MSFDNILIVSLFSASINNLVKTGIELREEHKPKHDQSPSLSLLN